VVRWGASGGLAQHDVRGMQFSEWRERMDRKLELDVSEPLWKSLRLQTEARRRFGSYHDQPEEEVWLQESYILAGASVRC